LDTSIKSQIRGKWMYFAITDKPMDYSSYNRLENDGQSASSLLLEGMAQLNAARPPYSRPKEAKLSFYDNKLLSDLVQFSTKVVADSGVNPNCPAQYTVESGIYELSE
ncbi:hypothetical protein RRG08_040332, partial [Elysia crispata]